MRITCHRMNIVYNPSSVHIKNNKYLTLKMSSNIIGGLHFKHGSSWSIVAPAIEESKPEGLLSSIVGGVIGMAGGEVSINGVINRKSIDDQSYTEQKGVILRKGYTENIEAISRSVKEMQLNTNQSEESALAESLVVSYEKMQQLRESISIHQQNVDRYESSIDQSQSHILNTSDDRKNQMQTGLLGSI